MLSRSLHPVCTSRKANLNLQDVSQSSGRDTEMLRMDPSRCGVTGCSILLIAGGVITCLMDLAAGLGIFS